MADEKPPLYEYDPTNDQPHPSVSRPANQQRPQTDGTPNDEGERRVRRKLEESAARNSELLAELMDTMNAPGALANNQTKLKHLEEELKKQEATLRDNSTATKAALKYHKKYRDSVGRKWYYILTKMRNNFDAKASEGEKAYIDAVEVQAKAESRQKQLQDDSAQVERENEPLQEQAKKHGAAHKKIDDLYSSIFSGPTPGFPDEDERELKYIQAKTEHDESTKVATAIAKSTKTIAQVKGAIERARIENGRAYDDINYSLFSFGSAYVWLERCDRFIGRAGEVNQDGFDELPEPLDTLLRQSYENLKKVLRAAARATRNTIDAPYPEREQLVQGIQDIYSELTTALERHKTLMQDLKEHEASARQGISVTARKLETARQALQEIRQGAFEVVAGFGAAAPAYNECCDRAESFEDAATQACQRVPVPNVDEIQDLPPPPEYDDAVRQRQWLESNNHRRPAPQANPT